MPSRERQHALQFGQVELAVGIGEGDQLKCGHLKTAAQRGPVAAIALVAQEPHMAIGRGRACHDGAGGVGAAVVHDNDLIVGGEQGQSRIRLLDRLLDGFGLVSGREDERELITPCCSLQGSVACGMRIRQFASHRGRLMAGRSLHVFVPPTSSPFKEPDDNLSGYPAKV